MAWATWGYLLSSRVNTEGDEIALEKETDKAKRELARMKAEMQSEMEQIAAKTQRQRDALVQVEKEAGLRRLELKTLTEVRRVPLVGALDLLQLETLSSQRSASRVWISLMLPGTVSQPSGSEIQHGDPSSAVRRSQRTSWAATT